MPLLRVILCVSVIGFGFALPSSAEPNTGNLLLIKKEPKPLAHEPKGSENSQDPEIDLSIADLLNKIETLESHMCRRDFALMRSLAHQCPDGGTKLQLVSCDVHITGDYPNCNRQEICTVLNEGLCQGGGQTLLQNGDGGGDSNEEQEVNTDQGEGDVIATVDPATEGPATTAAVASMHIEICPLKENGDFLFAEAVPTTSELNCVYDQADQESFGLVCLIEVNNTNWHALQPDADEVIFRCDASREECRFSCYY